MAMVPRGLAVGLERENERLRRELALVWLLVVVLMFLILRPLGIAVVRGTSMEPALRDGEVCLYSRLPRVHAGCVVLAWHRGDLLCHRVLYSSANEHGNTIYTLSGDKGAHYCDVGKAQIRGVIVWPRCYRDPR